MTTADAVGLVAVFAVEAISLLYVPLLGKPEYTAAMAYAGTPLFFATSVAIISVSIATTALTCGFREGQADSILSACSRLGRRGTEHSTRRSTGRGRKTARKFDRCQMHSERR